MGHWTISCWPKLNNDSECLAFRVFMHLLNLEMEIFCNFDNRSAPTLSDRFQGNSTEFSVFLCCILTFSPACLFALVYMVKQLSRELRVMDQNPTKGSFEKRCCPRFSCIVNSRLACAARVTVFVVCVCLSVSLHEQSVAPQAIPRIQRRIKVEKYVGFFPCLGITA